MPLPAYGVLVGTLDHFAREDQNSYGSYYHGKLYVATPAGMYECAVDVSTPAGVQVEYRSKKRLSTSLMAPVLALPSGWHLLACNATSGALDYIRSPLFSQPRGCLTIIYSPWIEAINRYIRSLDTGWRLSTGNNALNELEGLLTGCKQVLVFGAPYNSGLGVHDIHMNQGDPPGQFQHLDGIWQDGGVIIKRPDDTYSAFMVKFATQSLQTDDNGLPI